MSIVGAENSLDYLTIVKSHRLDSGTYDVDAGNVYISDDPFKLCVLCIIALNVRDRQHL